MVLTFAGGAPVGIVTTGFSDDNWDTFGDGGWDQDAENITFSSVGNYVASLIEQENSEPSNSSDMEEKVISMFEELNNDAINFQQLYYAERKHILSLDQQRCYK